MLTSYSEISSTEELKNYLANYQHTSALLREHSFLEGVGGGGWAGGIQGSVINFLPACQEEKRQAKKDEEKKGYGDYNWEELYKSEGC